MALPAVGDKFYEVRAFALSAGFYGSYVRFYMRECAKGSNDDSEGIRKLNGMFMLVYFGVALLCIFGGLLMVFFVHELFHNGLTPNEIILARSLLIIMSVNIAVTMISTPFPSGSSFSKS